MPFVKLDCGILRSTIWLDRDAREVFLTALLMAEPRELREPEPQVEPRNCNLTGWSVPPGWYGFVSASGPGIVRQAGLAWEAGLDALERLASPEPESRSPDFDGRRMVRVDGGFIVLNFQKFRDRDYGAAERMRRFRQRKRSDTVTPERDTVTLRDTPGMKRNVTQAEAEAEAEAEGEERTEEKTERRRFAPPTLADVRTFFAVSALTGDPAAFFDHFTSNGWKVSGKAPMKDWHAAARSWSRREEAPPQTRVVVHQNQRDIDEADEIARNRAAAARIRREREDADIGFPDEEETKP